MSTVLMVPPIPPAGRPDTHPGPADRGVASQANSTALVTRDPCAAERDDTAKNSTTVQRWGPLIPREEVTGAGHGTECLPLCTQWDFGCHLKKEMGVKGKVRGRYRGKCLMRLAAAQSGTC